MANTRNGNTYYIDTQYATNEELAVRNLQAAYVIVTATAANAVLVLADSSVGTKLDLRVATSGETKCFDFSDVPVTFSTSIRPTTLTNALATVVLKEIRT